jgi:hypothetical protein
MLTPCGGALRTGSTRYGTCRFSVEFGSPLSMILRDERKQIRRVHEAGVRDGRLAKNKRGYSRIPMKLSLGQRTRQRLRIRVPASPPSFVNALQTGSFGTWVHFRKVRRQPLLPIREGLRDNQGQFALRGASQTELNGWLAPNGSASVGVHSPSCRTRLLRRPNAVMQ